ncbi:hypothetical protein GCM10010129_38840 [Streptomyces fumigatiscleroticus]|nr:hypothetical protein GCM10010129_38840 [Streptomyces fumigatiscleroticus]
MISALSRLELLKKPGTPTDRPEPEWAAGKTGAVSWTPHRRAAVRQTGQCRRRPLEDAGIIGLSPSS